MNTVISIDILRGTSCEWPRFENDEYIMTAGSYRPLEEAFRIAQSGLFAGFIPSSKMRAESSAPRACRRLAVSQRRCCALA